MNSLVLLGRFIVWDLRDVVNSMPHLTVGSGIAEDRIPQALKEKAHAESISKGR
jgi:hypothetical protein